MSNTMRKAIVETLENWNKLDAYHQGKDYQKAVDDLKKMLEEEK